MSMTAVKVCGIMRPEDAVAAAEAGADFVGLVFAPSRRRVTAEQARAILQGLRKGRPDPPQAVGVFADMPADEVNRIAREAGVDRVQLSGHEPPEYRRLIHLPVIKAVKLPQGMAPGAARELLETTSHALQPETDLCLVEPYVEGAYGGTGTPYDSAVVEGLDGFTFLLAGGLTAETVGGAVRRLKPWGVDVSSGVETDGAKDKAKIARFVFEAKRAGGWRP
jgi:phosphoribosylanthranilate isomerase